MEKFICAELDRPILFRTTTKDVYESTLRSGSLWLRSAEYYQTLEDKSRNDRLEGINCSKMTIPLNFSVNGSQITIQGSGKIGQHIIPHYIISLHGISISKQQHQEFGGFTFGIRCLSKLASEILYKTSLVTTVVGYRFGQVSYQYSSLIQTNHPEGTAPICIGGEPPRYLTTINSDVLRKEPILPFIEQDEWRIVVFVDRYLADDPKEPLKIEVGIDNFYEYIANL